MYRYVYTCVLMSYFVTGTSKSEVKTKFAKYT